MPLPVSDVNLAWPPKDLEQILPRMAQWSAWWANSLERLQAAYGGGQSMDATGFFASDTGGFKAAVGRTMQRWFVGQRPLGADRNTKLPSPIAAGICQASADLMFSDPITVKVTDKATQARIEVLLDDNFHSTIAEGAEAGAALGGVYLRATWDDSVVPDAPFTTIVDADQAIPEFKWGRLVAVTFWSVVFREGKIVRRHLERHELVNGNGVILHGLYEGEEDKLGIQVSLNVSATTAPMALRTDLNLEGTIDTKSPGLAVEYVPNQTPNRIWRSHPIGRNLGRSDLDGIEHLLDQHAENLSDWMRARRAARARVMVAKDLVKSAGPGQGQVVDLDQETYVATSFVAGVGPSGTPNLADRVQVLQPTFNPEQYKITGEALFEQIIQTAGYSMQTFGVDSASSGDTTATEVEARERRSLMTRSRKIREWRPALERHLKKLLALDNAFFNGQNSADDLIVEFADGVQESQLRLAQTAQALYASESASVHERVTMLHPDWDEKQIGDEVKAIEKEFAHASLTDPAMTPFDDEPTEDQQPDGSDPAAKE